MKYKSFNNETTRSSVLKALGDKGNAAAWNRFFDLYAGFVFSIARDRGLNAEDADDVVQEVFSALARTMGKFQYDRAKGKFRSYLLSLVIWRVMDHLRAKQSEAKAIAHLAGDLPDMPDPSSVTVDEFTDQEWRAAAQEEAFRRLRAVVKPDHYAAYVASVVEGMDTDTVTKLYGVTRDNLYQIRSRLSAQLKVIYDQVLKEMDLGPR